MLGQTVRPQLYSIADTGGQLPTLWTLRVNIRFYHTLLGVHLQDTCHTRDQLLIYSRDLRTPSDDDIYFMKTSDGSTMGLIIKLQHVRLHMTLYIHAE